MTAQNLIFYPTGCYGTFFEWLFNYLEDPVLALPFTETGSSHNFVGNFFEPKEKLFEHVQSNCKIKYSRVHPGLFEKINHSDQWFRDEYHNNIQNDLDFLKKYFDKILIVAYDQQSVLWNENNQLEKAHMSEQLFNDQYARFGYTTDSLRPIMVKDSVQRIKCFFKTLLELNSPCAPFTYKNLQGWNKTNIDDFEIWELRELVSFWWFTKTDQQIMGWEKIKNSNKDVLCVSISDLRENFTSTVLHTAKYFGISSVEESTVSQIHQQWRPLQHQINKDLMCKHIVECLINRECLDWSTAALSLIDEAWIQKKLRDNQIGIRCHNLNIFPTNTDDFLPLLEH